MSWETLDDFIDTMNQWTEVQRHLESIGAQRAPSTRLIAFGRPYLADDSTLILPNGPAREQMDDGRIELTVTKDYDCYSLRQTGYERSDSFTGRQEWRSSNFELMGKYILARKNGGFRQKIGAPSAFQRWLDIGLAPQWIKQHMSHEEAGVDWLYKFTDTSSSNVHYYDYENGDALTFPFSMSYHEITNTYMEGVPQPQ
jgi:hypothetical protein